MSARRVPVCASVRESDAEREREGYVCVCVFH